MVCLLRRCPTARPADSWPASLLLRRAAVAGLLVLLAVAASPAAAQQEPTWLTGPAFHRALAEETTVAWGGIPFGDALSGLARRHGVAVVLDRRVDPTRTLVLEGKFPLRDAFLNAARVYSEKHTAEGVWPRPALPLDVAFFGPVVYVGPTEAARHVRTVAEQRREDVRQVSPAKRNRLVRSATSQWDDAAEPRQLVADLAKEAGVTVENAAAIPHDLWRANSLPALPWCDRLTLILVQFDLTFAISPDGSRLQLRPITESDRTITRTYPGGSNPESAAAAFREKAPEAQVQTRGNQIVIAGRLEDHEAASGKAPSPAPSSQTLSSRAAASPASPGIDQYSLKINELPLRAVLDYLARNLKLELQVDEAALQAAGLSLDRRVSFQVENVSLDQLLEAAVKPAGLTAKRQGQTVQIVPAN